MRKGSLLFLCGLLAGVLFLSGCGGEEAEVTAEPTPSTPAAERQTVEVILDFELLTRSQMIEAARAIFVGQVVGISTTAWNQDSGDYWEQTLEGTTLTAMPVHQLEVAVVEMIVDEIGLGETAVLTIIGKSPADVGVVPISESLVLGGTADYELAVGDQVILFVTEREIGWWNEDEQMEYVAERGEFVGARRPVLAFANHPSASFLLLGEDGLYYPQPIAPEFEEGGVSLDALLAEIK
jgi:hypothetical protein